MSYLNYIYFYLTKLFMKIDAIWIQMIVNYSIFGATRDA